MKKLITTIVSIVLLILPVPVNAQLTVTDIGAASDDVAACLPLDCAGVAAFMAWSPRKLRAAWAGDALVVRRTSDSTTQSIGFTGADLNTTSLLSFCAATDCFVTLMYDQSGNGIDVSNPNTIQQPKIVSAGALTVTYNSKAVLEFVGANGTFLSNVSLGTLPTGAPWTMFGVVNATTGNNVAFGNNGKGIVGGGGSVAGLNFIQGTFCAACFVAYNNGASTVDRTASVNYTFGTTGVFIGRWDASDPNPLKAYINGGTPGIGTNVNQNNVGGPVYYGCHRGCGLDTNAMNGSVSDVYFFDFQISIAATNILGANAATYYGIMWTDISI